MLLFSDLHLSPKTFETSMKVLRRVHKEAVERHVSVGFLGDFFDTVYNRGTLPVDILNELLRYFADEWHVPMIMIPGNHDYFDASETEHGLTPFKYASKFITVLDEPTVVANRLWMPWRRDPVVCKRIIDAHPSVDVIFGHFDIIGFKLNAKRVSTEGLSLEMFPKGTPVYTGHYHTPQTHQNIVYLGSPYQLTLSEAEDKKALVLLDVAGNISCKIPIDLGRKQYKWSATMLLARSTILNSKDRVSVTGTPSMELVRKLREQGIQVDVKKIVPEIETRIKEPSSLSETQLLNEYAKIHHIGTESEAWLRLRQKLEDLVQTTVTMETLKQVKPVKMSISGFGPFVGPVSVSLQGQGFTLISGEMEESSGSNGAGKSMITAGALLWVLTGLIDGRNQMSFENGSSVLHNGTGPTEIHLTGLVDQKPFCITRTLSANPRRHTITFSIDQKDRTRSTISATQRAISEEIFGIGMSASELWNWLLRNSCWSQQHVHRFCDASDSQAKQEIGELANMQLWNNLHAWAKETLKETVAELKRLDPEEKRTGEQYTNAVERHARALRMHVEWKQDHTKRLEQSQQDIDRMTISVERVHVPLQKPQQPQNSTLQLCKRKLQGARDCKIRLETQRESISAALPNKWKEITSPEKPDRDLDEFHVRVEQCKSSMTARRVQLTAGRTALETFQTNSACSACHRPFGKESDRDTHLRSLQSDVEAGKTKHLDSVNATKAAVTSLKTMEKMHSDYENYQSIQKNAAIIRDIDSKLSTSEIQGLQQRVEELEKTFNQEQQLYTDYTRRLKTAQDMSRALDALKRASEAVRIEISPYGTSDTEVVETLQKKRSVALQAHQTRIEQQHAKKCVQWTGTRGIQTYIMEHTVKKLAARTTNWLQKFFGPETFFEAMFDSKERLVRRVVSPGNTGVMSGGQWRRVQLASFMAWKSMKASAWPLLIMDECCTSMDQPGIEAVQEILRDWCEEDNERTCYFITHEPGQFRDTSIYQNHIRVQNKRGRSSLFAESEPKRQKVSSTS
jgi:DNA repair exonuclease SbcCD nuclease subunit